MTELCELSFEDLVIEDLAALEGILALPVEDPTKRSLLLRRLDRLTRGAISKALQSKAFGELKHGGLTRIGWPAGMAAEEVILQKIDKKAIEGKMVEAGAALGMARKGKRLTLLVSGTYKRLGFLAQGLLLGSYKDEREKSKPGAMAEEIIIRCAKFAEEEANFAALRAVAEGVYLTRNLVNSPANRLTTTAFADEVKSLSKLGMEIEIIEESELEKLGMRLLLSVGQGSESPSYVGIMRWSGGSEGDAPLALIGKGVVFDTGGISLKPAQGMEDMTMDMGGAGTVLGTMKALALRKAKANVVGLVGLVENMPSGRATRPGDIVTSMKGETVEIINTDAEGRLVLADVMWLAQQRFKPTAMIDLATLTGAIIIGLGHEKAGVFSNDDGFAKEFLQAASEAGEGAWQMPLGEAYDAQLISRLADMKNVGGRAAGSITAAQFLQRFIEKPVEEQQPTPWIHLDIAGVAARSTDWPTGPKGASGWGVRALDRLVSHKFEAQ